MNVTNPEQALSFYRAALPAARLVDASSDPRTLDDDADAAWKAYGDDLPAVVRCDLVLRNLAMLYPAAFAPGPVFALTGWYEDNPWGSGFERPPPQLVEAAFSKRIAPASLDAAFDEALEAWGLPRAPSTAVDPRIVDGLTRATNLVVCGTRAMLEVARAFAHDERLSIRAQVLLVTSEPAARHLLGLACAMTRNAGPAALANAARADGEGVAEWARREGARVGMAQAKRFVVSSDASASGVEAATELAHALGASDRIDRVGA